MLWEPLAVAHQLLQVLAWEDQLVEPSGDHRETLAVGLKIHGPLEILPLKLELDLGLHRHLLWGTQAKMPY